MRSRRPRSPRTTPACTSGCSGARLTMVVGRFFTVGLACALLHNAIMIAGDWARPALRGFVVAVVRRSSWRPATGCTARWTFPGAERGAHAVRALRAVDERQLAAVRRRHVRAASTSRGCRCRSPRRWSRCCWRRSISSPPAGRCAHDHRTGGPRRSAAGLVSRRGGDRRLAAPRASRFTAIASRATSCGCWRPGPAAARRRVPRARHRRRHRAARRGDR